MTQRFEKYFAAVEYLESIFNLPQPDYKIIKKGREVFIKRMKYFLNLLDNPQNGLKFIHVGGTSGKGTIVNMIQSILTEAGWRVGRYTSPFPTTTIEKYKVGEKLINPNDFVRILESMKPAIDRCYLKSPFGRPSYFEICIALAFLYFKEQKCDYVVLEVGLGGKFDATNIISNPEIVVINKISLDHVNVLGNNLIDIAEEKAGIIKPKTRVFINGKNSKKVISVFEKVSKKNRARLFIVKPERIDGYQSENQSLATAVAGCFGISRAEIERGIKKVKISCRFEIMQKNPLVILDGAHNQAKMKTVVENLKKIKSGEANNLTYKKLYLIIALTRERSALQVFKEIKNLADYPYTTRYKSSRHKCYPPLKLAKKIKFHRPAKIFLDPDSAPKDALKQADKNDLILVTGSFYLAGRLRTHWRKELTILKERKS